MKEFTYLEAGKYIAQKWGAELWQSKYKIVSFLILSFIPVVKSENIFSNEDGTNDSISQELRDFLKLCSESLSISTKTVDICIGELDECRDDYNEALSILEQQNPILKIIYADLSNICSSNLASNIASCNSEMLSMIGNLINLYEDISIN